MTGLAIPKKNAPPPRNNSLSWSGPNWNTTVLLEATMARLRAIDSMPSVTTNGGMPR